MIDTFVTQASPSANRARTPKLRLSGATGDRKRAYLFFGQQFAVGDDVFDGKLTVTLATAWTGQDLVIRRVTEPWSEQRLTWNTEPANTTDDAVTIAIAGAEGDQVELDITPLLVDVAAGAAWAGLRFSIESDAERAIYSSDAPNASQRPSIEVDWQEKPDPISEMSPAGGQAVATDNPELTWQLPGEDEDRARQAASHVQVSATEDFTAPEYDSGAQANTLTSWTGYGGIDNGDVRFWRVRYQNAAGQWSEWSDVHEFTRVDKPVLVITSPGSVTEDATPPVAWDCDGQESWELELSELTVKGALELWKTPRAVGTEQEHTIPAGLNRFGRRKVTYEPLIRSGGAYKATVRVWDGVDRAATPGDPPYVEASIEFVYERDGSPDPVPALTAEAFGPGVRLSWSRDARPDYFSLRVDGVEVDTRIEPEDVSSGGDDYEMVFWGARRGTEREYEIEAVVLDAGKYRHSADNASATLWLPATGLWIVDEDLPDEGAAIEIIGEGDGPTVDLAIRALGETIDIPGARKPVQIIESVQGYSGSIAGHVDSLEHRNAFLAMRGRLAPVRLIAFDLNFPCELEGDTGVTPHRAPGLYAVSARVFQVGEYTFDVAGEGSEAEVESIDSEGVLI